MANPRLSPEQLRTAVEAVGKHGNCSKAARALGLPDATFRAWWQRAKEEGLVGKSQPVSTVEILNRAPLVDPPDVSRGLPFEREWSKWMDAVGMVRDRYAGPAKVKALSGTSR